MAGKVGTPSGDVDTYDSTSKQRVQVGENTVRHQYRELTPNEQAQMTYFKDIGQAFIDTCIKLQGNTHKANLKREYALAITHMEDAVMRAVRGVTG